MATASGTARLARRLAATHLASSTNSSQRIGLDLIASPFGVGGYRIPGQTTQKIQHKDVDGNESQEDRFKRRLRCAIKAGCNVIDTSPSGDDEHLVGEVLEQVIAEGIAQRDELILVTRLGHVPQNCKSVPPEALALSAGKQTQASDPTPPPARWHCMHPEFLRDSVEMSTSRLGTKPDVVLLHDPDIFLAHALRAGHARPAAHAELEQRIRTAFTCLEELVAAGHVSSCYGVAANLAGCRWSVSGRPNGYEAIALDTLLAAARTTGDKHHFGVIQVPINVLELGAVVGTPDTPSLLRQARNSGVAVLATRAINAVCPQGIKVGDWGKEGDGDYLELCDRSPQPPLFALLNTVLSHHLSNHIRSEKHTLPELALLATSFIPGVTVTMLDGFQSSDNFDLAHAGVGRLEDEKVWAMLDHLQDAIVEAGGK